MSTTKKRRRRKVLESVRCKATNRWGEPCKAWAIKGSVVCVKHGGAAPQVRRKAQERIMMAADDAASLLVRFMASEDVPFAERRRCAEFLLTYENRNEVQLKLAPWEQHIVDGILFTDASDPVIDVEVIEARPAIPPSDQEWRDEVVPEKSPPKYGVGKGKHRH